MGLRYTLIGTDFDPSTAKLRSFLDWRGILYEEKQATPEVGRDILEPAFGEAAYPALFSSDRTAYMDTSEAIESISAMNSPDELAGGGYWGFLGALLELYGDEWLGIPAAYYRWSRNEAWILNQYAALAGPSIADDQRQKLGRILAEPAIRLAEMQGVSDETAAGIEAHYEGFLADFGAHLRRNPFVLGEQPSLADFAFFGPLYASLYLDPASGEFMRMRAPLVADWIERLRRTEPQPQTRAASGQPGRIPPTLLPILKRQMSEQGAELAEAARLFDEWAGFQPAGARIPETVGSHEFSIGGRRGERSVFVRPLWKLQRLSERFAALKLADAEAARHLLEEVGGSFLLANAPARLIGRRQNRFVLEAVSH